MQISNDELQHEIWQSKLTYCDCTENINFTDLDSVNYMQTYSHIPVKQGAPKIVRHPRYRHRKTNFPPFQVRRKSKTIIISHMNNGRFDTGHGQITPRLDVLIYEMCNNIAKLPNFSHYFDLDQWVVEAYMEVRQSALQFDHLRTANAFGFLTRAIKNELIKQIKKYKSEIDDYKTYARDTLTSIDENIPGSLDIIAPAPQNPKTKKKRARKCWSIIVNGIPFQSKSAVLERFGMSVPYFNRILAGEFAPHSHLNIHCIEYPNGEKLTWSEEDHKWTDRNIRLNKGKTTPGKKHTWEFQIGSGEIHDMAVFANMLNLNARTIREHILNKNGDFAMHLSDEPIHYWIDDTYCGTLCDLKNPHHYISGNLFQSSV